MSDGIIEGFGDEVVYVLTFLFGALVVLIAWISTHVRDDPTHAATNNTHGLPIGQQCRLLLVHFQNVFVQLIDRLRQYTNQLAGVNDETGSTDNDNNSAQEHAADDTTEATDNRETIVGSGEDQGLSGRSSSSSTSQQLNDDSVAPRLSGNQSADVSSQSPPSQSQPTFVEAVPGHIRVKVKFLNESERIILTKPSETILEFKLNHFSNEVTNGKLVRFVFNGAQLPDESTLEQCQIRDNTVIHCLISDRSVGNSPRDHAVHDDDSGFELGFMMLPMFGIVLGLVWYIRIMYRSFFNSVSTMLLVTLSLMFLLAVWLAVRRPIEQQAAAQRQATVNRQGTE